MTLTGAMEAAAKDGNATAIRKELSKGKCHIDAISQDGSTALHWACSRNHIDTARILLQEGASIDVQSNDGSTALHYALECEEHSEILQMLLDYRANVNLQDNEGTINIENMTLIDPGGFAKVLLSPPLNNT